METLGVEGAARVDGAGEAVAQGVAGTEQPQQPLRPLMEDISAQPLYRDNMARLLVDGPETYDAMLGAINGAREFVHLETYIFNDDEVGQRFADALRQTAARGIEVRLIYDSIGSMESSEEFFARMEEAGVALVEFNPVNPAEGGNPLDVNVRDHRKQLIVDGTMAFTGGINIDRSYSSSSFSAPSPNTGWRDTHVEIRGPAVAGFQRLFLSTWNEQGGRRLGPDERYLSAPRPTDGGHLVRVLAADGGDEQVSPIRIAYKQAMEAARERIWITASYFAPDPEFLRTLRESARRGVDVRIAVAGKEASDAPMLVHASRSFYGKLLKAGVRIYESQDTMLHAKTAVIDGIWSTVGSSNLDYRSFLHNDEVNAVIFGEDFARQMEDLYRFDLERAREVTLEDWRSRPLFDRVKEIFSRMLQYWL